MYFEFPLIYYLQYILNVIEFKIILIRNFKINILTVFKYNRFSELEESSHYYYIILIIFFIKEVK